MALHGDFSFKSGIPLPSQNDVACLVFPSYASNTNPIVGNTIIESAGLVWTNSDIQPNNIISLNRGLLLIASSGTRICRFPTSNSYSEIYWEYTVERPSILVANENRVYSSTYVVGKYTEYIRALNCETGTLIWEINYSSLYSNSSGSIDSNGSIYFLRVDTLIKVSSSGDIIWTIPVSCLGSSGCTLFIDKANYLYFNSISSVYKYDTDGNEINSYPSSTILGLSLVVDLNNNLFLGTSDGYIYKFSEEGSLIWSSKIGNSVFNISVSDDGRIFAACDNSLYRINKNGTEGWVYTDTDNIQKVEIDKNGYIYCGGRATYLKKLEDIITIQT